MAHDTRSFIDQGNDALLGDKYEFRNPWFKAGFLVWFLSLLYCWFGLPVSEFRQAVVEEVTILQGQLTQAQSDELFERINRWYKVSMVDTGVSNSIDKLYINNNPENKTATFIGGMTARLVDNTKMWWYRSIVRINALFEWLVLGSVLIFAFISDAYYNYRKRAHNFNRHNIKLASIAWRLVAMIVFSLWVFLVVPLIDGSLWRYLPLGFIAVSIILSTTIIREYQRF